MSSAQPDQDRAPTGAREDASGAQQRDLALNDEAYGDAHDGDAYDDEASQPLLGARTNPRTARRWWVVGTVLVSALTALIVWAVLAQERSKVHWRDLRTETLDARTFRAQFDVTRDPSRTVVCTVRAMDVNLATVGSTQVTIPAGGPRTVVRTVTIRTTERAAGGGVRECVVAPDGT